MFGRQAEQQPTIEQEFAVDDALGLDIGLYEVESNICGAQVARVKAAEAELTAPHSQNLHTLDSVRVVHLGLSRRDQV